MLNELFHIFVFLAQATNTAETSKTSVGVAFSLSLHGELLALLVPLVHGDTTAPSKLTPL